MSRYLDLVEGPEYVKKLKPDQLLQLAEEIRYELITVLSKNGGHLGPNLGVVELTLALHRVFSTPKDRFVWDVSHQAYVHKLLTGRRVQVEAMNMTDVWHRPATRTARRHRCCGARPGGTAVCAAHGMVVARDTRGSDENIVCIFGDAALTNGISFEALNNIGQS